MGEKYSDGVKRKDVTVTKYLYRNDEVSYQIEMLFVLVGFLLVSLAAWNTLAPTTFLERFLAIGMLVIIFLVMIYSPTAVRSVLVTKEIRE